MRATFYFFLLIGFLFTQSAPVYAAQEHSIEFSLEIAPQREVMVHIPSEVAQEPMILQIEDADVQISFTAGDITITQDIPATQYDHVVDSQLLQQFGINRDAIEAISIY